MEKTFCQSCGMPLETEEQKGTNKDDTINHEYCTYCFKEGEFTQDLTMDEMINHCANFVDDFNKDSEVKYSKEEAISNMKKFFPQLKRWCNN